MRYKPRADTRAEKGEPQPRWWLGGQPIASCWHLSLSTIFPRGEIFFIEAVKAHRDGAPPALAADIRAFIRQEANHAREHEAFNRQAERCGYDLSSIHARGEFLAMQREQSPIRNLAATAALEHFTAMFARDHLRHGESFAAADPAVAALWRWHAIEEIEHKGVAYDTWLHATQSWSRWRQWQVRSATMLAVTRNFVAHRIADTLDLLAQDGRAGWRVRLAVLAWLFGKPGVLRRMIPAWIGWFLPGFHPWNRDDHTLISKVSAPALSPTLPPA